MRILWLKTELLHPLDKGGRIRTYQTLRFLARNHHITYLTLDDGKAADNAVELAQEYCAEVVRVPIATTTRGSLSFYGELARNAISPLPYSIWKYRSSAFRRELEQRAAGHRLDLVVCDFLAPAVNLPSRLPLPTLLFQHNVEAEIFRRHADVATNAITRAYFRSQWRRMEAFEHAACRRFDEVIAVSEIDREHFESAYGLNAVSNIPTGVDTDFFRPADEDQHEPGHLVFTGAMDWMPNEQGVIFFVQNVLPRIRSAVPGTTFTIVGRNPGPQIRALNGQAGIHVTGTVPDIRPYLKRASVFVVPLQIGGGTRLKIFEAMAMGCPVVSTSIGAEGLPLRDGEHLCLADTAGAMARACVELLNDPVRAGQMGRAGAENVHANFGCDRAAARFEAICTEAVNQGIRVN